MHLLLLRAPKIEMKEKKNENSEKQATPEETTFSFNLNGYTLKSKKHITRFNAPFTLEST